MLKNVKFLYCIIVFLLIVCILGGIHITVDRNMMFERRTHYVNTVSAQAEGVHEWIKVALNENDPFNSVAAAKNYLNLLTDTANVAAFYRFDYNEIFSVKVFFGGASEFYFNLIHIGERFDKILENLSKNPVLSEEDKIYLEEAEKAFCVFIEKLEPGGTINPYAVKNDVYLTYACMELSDIAK